MELRALLNNFKASEFPKIKMSQPESVTKEKDA